MELRALAEAVLFSAGMDGKLLRPDALTDAAPGLALVQLPDAPGRPAGLVLGAGKKAPFPADLTADSGRGLAMHFFANHELLAMELMALMLLRFPDADPAFRMDLARTIAEEQDHLRLYQGRMEALGVGLGDLPVSAFFWQAMRGAPDPLTFVVQMALTFEQANLDYCLHYKARFLAEGDAASADVLEQVYQDEVGHVLHGVRWFNAWRPPGESDWEAYLKRLPAPMTPARAKGPVLDVAGRRRAGLSEDFVRHLAVYSASKGRRPRLWLFEPWLEEALAAGDAPFTPAAQVTALARDLAPAFALLGSPDDQVLLDAAPPLGHLEHLAQAGLQLPEVVLPSDLEAILQDDLRAPERVVPWGVTARAAALARRVGAPLPEAPVRRWSSKLASRALLQSFLRDHADDRLLGPPDALLGEVVTTLDAALAAADAIRAAEPARAALVKAPLSASGRHRVRLLVGEALSPGQRGFLEGALGQAGALWVAPWLPRLRDMGVPFEVLPSGQVREDGPLWMLTAPKGAYLGHVLGPADLGLSAPVRRALHAHGPWLERVRAAVRAAGAALAESGYAGPAGLDVFIYGREEPAQVRLHPLVEVNPRHTMGHVARRLARAVAPGVLAVFAPVRARDAGDLAKWAEALPPPRRGERGLVSGVVRLADPTAARHTLPVLAVGSSIELLRVGALGAALGPLPTPA